MSKYPNVHKWYQEVVTQRMLTTGV